MLFATALTIILSATCLADPRYRELYAALASEVLSQRMRRAWRRARSPATTRKSRQGPRIPAVAGCGSMCTSVK